VALVEYIMKTAGHEMYDGVHGVCRRIMYGTGDPLVVVVLRCTLAL